jgi:hypothetical protein
MIDKPTLVYSREAKPTLAELNVTLQEAVVKLEKQWAAFQQTITKGQDNDTPT